MKGLLGRDELEGDEGILLMPCDSIHMFFMKFSIDVIFFDRDFKVLETFENVKPWKLIWPVRGARGCVELAEGVIREKRVKEGDYLYFMDGEGGQVFGRK